MLANMTDALAPVTELPKSPQEARTAGIRGDKLDLLKQHRRPRPHEAQQEKLASQKSQMEQVIGIPKYYISSWVKKTNSFRNLLNTSKGRDKVC